MKGIDSLKRVVCVICILVVGTLEAEDVDAAYEFDWPSQDLAEALEGFSRYTGVDVLARTELIEGKTASALSGTFTAGDALQVLLEENRLEFRFTSESTVAITEYRKPSERREPHKFETDLLVGTETDFVELAPYTVGSSGSRSVLNITKWDLQRRQAVDLEDVLSIDPSLTVGGSTGTAQKVYVRNLGEGLLNVSVDGAHQTGSLFHHIGRLSIEPELLKAVEVQPGVGNASDGPGALGGAIRFETLDPEDLLEEGKSIGGITRVAYNSNSEGYKATAMLASMLDDIWSSMVSLVRSKYQEIKDGEGNRLAGSGSQQRSVLAKLSGTFENGNSIRLSFESIEEEGEKLQRPEWAPSDSNPIFPMTSARQTVVLGYTIRPSDIDWLDVEATLSYSEGEVLQNAVWGPYLGSIKSTQLDFRNRQFLDGYEFVYGFDLRKDTVLAGPEVDPAFAEENGSVFGLFAQIQQQASEAMLLSYGIRYDQYDLDDRKGQRFEHQGLSPNFGFTYRLSDSLSLTGGYAGSYRGPDVNDAFRIDFAENDPNLSAERAHNYELGLNFVKGGWNIELGAYDHRIEDVITNTLPWGHVYSNAGLLKTDGVYARGLYETGNVRFSMQYNSADTKIDGRVATRYQYGSLVSTVGNTWVAEATWNLKQRLSLGWTCRLVEGIDGILIPFSVTGLEDTRIEKNGYATHDLSLEWQPLPSERWVINLTVKNSTNKMYLSHGSVENLSSIPGFEAVSGAPEPGRDIRVSARLRF